MYVSHAMKLKKQKYRMQENFQNIDILAPCVLLTRYIALKPVRLHSISLVSGINSKKGACLDMA
jgi:hypothetical protein